MKNHTFWAVLITALFFFSQFSQNAKAVDLITNGSFETGTFAGWTAVNAAGSWNNWQNTTGGFSTGFHSTSPQHGTRSVWTGVTANAGGVYTLSQQVTIPAGNSAALSWKSRFQLDYASFCSGAACGTATFSVQILNTSNVLLQTLHTQTVVGGQIFNSGWLNQSANLSAYAGQTIIIRFRTAVTQTLAGPGMLEIDQVVLNAFVPTAAEAVVSGRVMNGNGQGIRNASVTITAPDGTSRTVTTGSFGYYRFENVEVGETYTISVGAKRFRFGEPTRIVSVNDNVADVDFVAVE